MPSGNSVASRTSDSGASATVAANAYVGPQVATYIKRLEDDLERAAFGGSLFMMGSNGGLLSVDRACRQPVALVESGPIGGCIGAGDYAKAAALYKAALGKSGVDSGLANLRLGEALAMSGDKAGATAAFNAVTGSNAQVAKYWLLFLSKRG